MKAVLVLLMLGFLVPAAAADSFPALYEQYERALRSRDPAQILSTSQAAYKAAKLEHKGEEFHALAAYHHGLAQRWPSDAVPYLAESVDVYTAIKGETDEILIGPLLQLGRNLARDTKKQHALAAYRRLEKVLSANGKDDPQTLYALQMDRAHAYAFDDDPKGALRMVSEAEGLLPRLGDLAAFYEADLSFNRGKFYTSAGRDERALENFRQAVKGFEAALPHDDVRLLSARGFLVVALGEAGHEDEALPQLELLAFGRAGMKEDEYLPIYQVQPVYPKKALKNYWQGQSVVELTIGPDGRVEEARIVETTNSVFDKPSLAAARRFLYAPKIVDGKLARTEGVRYTFEYSMTFR